MKAPQETEPNGAFHSKETQAPKQPTVIIELRNYPFEQIKELKNLLPNSEIIIK
jgi:hypothetical protein